MAPQIPPRGSIARSPVSPYAAMIPDPITPPRRPNRPSAILTTPRTPSGARPPDSGSSSVGADASEPSSTRSGRPYLPDDTGIPAWIGSRRPRSAVRLEGSPITPSRRGHEVVNPSQVPQTPIDDQFERTDSLAPSLDQDTLSASPASSTQLHEDQHAQTVDRCLTPDNEEQEITSHTTKPFTSAENNQEQSDIRPENPASATTTNIPTHRTAMERDIQSLLSLPHEKRHADHQSNHFAVPDDMDDWVRDNLGSHSPSP